MTVMEGRRVDAPLSGTVFEVMVTVGAEVAEGDEVIVFESMKMEIPLEAPVSGRIVQVLVAPGDHVTEGDPVLVIA